MNPLEAYSPFTFNTEQRSAAEDLAAFINQDENNVFILHGHAGTGKTTLIDALIKYLKNKDIPVVLLASTGRAAKIVGEKAGCDASTVHRNIYILDVEKTDDENKIRRLVFRLRVNEDAERAVYIVDESSMISDHFTKGVFIDFGSGKLLTDLFRFLGPRKVIFSGDPCQLPPINTAFSPALNQAYLAETHKKVISASKLTQVMRYAENSGIFENTSLLRQSIERKDFGRLNIYVRRHSDLDVFSDLDSMVESYVSRIRQYGLEDALLICHTNAMAADLNRTTRSMLYPGKSKIVKGELLMVVQNNYKFNLANGEHMHITGIEQKSEQRAGLTFRAIEGYVNDARGQKIIKGLLIEDLLYAREPSLNVEQEYALFKDFAIRASNLKIRPKDPAYLDLMLSDPYLNAIRAKFGYAVTCHKAQGGEWPAVYIVLERSIFNPTARENQYRWMYTAISRGIKNVNFSDNWCIK
jgi:ATP-dependent exoDNAse (exonuclease V) alpha subunit